MKNKHDLDKKRGTGRVNSSKTKNAGKSTGRNVQKDWKPASERKGGMNNKGAASSKKENRNSSNKSFNKSSKEHNRNHKEGHYEGHRGEGHHHGGGHHGGGHHR